jgi:hypothetical protein
MRPLLRLAYRAILRLHPHAFRIEFGDEMLWIFDEESHHRNATPLLADGLRSIVVQHTMRSGEQQQAEAAGPYYCEIDSSLPAERFAQASLVVLCCSLSLSLFLSMVVPRVAAPMRGLLFTQIRIFPSVPAPPAKIQP